MTSLQEHGRPGAMLVNQSILVPLVPADYFR